MRWAVLVLAVLIPLIYSPILSLPFVQDDYTFVRGDISAVDASGKFHRPLATLYIYGMLRLFGENAYPFHVVALLIHFLTSVLVIKVVSFISEEALGMAAGFIYAFAACIHIETLIWAVGIHDLGGMFFFILSMWLFLSGRQRIGAGAYLVACLFKEQAIVLPLILLFWNWRRAAPYLVPLGIIIIYKSFGVSPLSLPAGDPYHVSLWGWHVLDNLVAYLIWLAQAFNPLGFLFFVVVGVSGLAFVEHPISRVPLAWLVFALLPVLFLPNHTYRYYAVYALPAVLIITLGGLGALLDMAGVQYRKSYVAITVLVVLFSVWFIHGVFEGVPIQGGSNNLIQKIERGR